MAEFSDSMKKFGSTTATFFSRAKQYTEEQLGKAEATEFDARFESLLERADRTKQWTERLLKQTEALLQPNPGIRAEEYFYSKLGEKKPERLTHLETLGKIMEDAGNELGPGTSYGSTLVKCGATEKKLASAERDFMTKSVSHYLHPLKSFLEGDMKTISTERRTLLAKRLDLDSCKAKVRKAQTPERIQQAESELRVAQAEFDRQYEVTKLLLDGIATSHANHHRALQSFIEAQAQYYAQCFQYMQDLQRQLGTPPPTDSVPLVPPTAPSAADVRGVLDVNAYPRPSVTKKAKVLYDYDATDSSELSLLSDEVITVYNVPGMDNDWMVGERGSQRGKVPVTYLELLS
ncbi:predicted protein [Nematostella vectensis]|uniref:Endophilin-B1 n=2 Tax=Nematostella vectensis TaxID=45351 RepID=A7SDK8_NEMVE|nr:predicted protein [Nematostella vectensis]|eukprot:XP_001630264.1 predicted protein [Nematostella vectensis]